MTSSAFFQQGVIVPPYFISEISSLEVGEKLQVTDLGRVDTFLELVIFFNVSK